MERRRPPTGSGGCSDTRQPALRRALAPPQRCSARFHAVHFRKGEGLLKKMEAVSPSSSLQPASCTASACDSRRLRHTSGSPRLVSASAPLRLCAMKQPAVATSTAARQRVRFVQASNGAAQRACQCVVAGVANVVLDGPQSSGEELQTAANT